MKVTADMLMIAMQREFAYFAPVPQDATKSLQRALVDVAADINRQISTDEFSLPGVGVVGRVLREEPKR